MTAGEWNLTQDRHSALGPYHFITIICVFTHFFLMTPSECVNCSEPTTVALLSALKESIFGRTEVRPVKSLQTPTNITVDLYIYGILGVDEKGQVLEMFIWLYLGWDIEGLYWDPEECGTNRISLPRNVLWMPDIIINEFMDENKAPPAYYLYVYSNGYTEDAQLFHVISSCNLDIYSFPFDIQNCSYTFNSYLHYASDVQLFFMADVKTVFQNSLDTIGTNGEWELIDLIASKPEKAADFDPKKKWDNVIFYIVLKRKSSVYVVNLLLPSCFLAALDVLSFLLPVQHVDRSAFKMTLILGYTVFLLLMSDLLPVTGNNIPLINVFFSVCLALMVVSLMETIIITNIVVNSAQYLPMPRWLRVLVLHYLAYLLFMKSKTDTPGGSVTVSACESSAAETPPQQEKTDPSQELLLQELRNISSTLSSVHQKIDNHLKTELSAEEWIRLAMVIDRGFFLLYIVFICTSFSTILVLWLHWYTQGSRA